MGKYDYLKTYINIHEHSHTNSDKVFYRGESGFEERFAHVHVNGDKPHQHTISNKFPDRVINNRIQMVS